MPRRLAPSFPLIAFRPIRGVPSTRDTSQPASVVGVGFPPYTRNVTTTMAPTATAVVARAGNSLILHGKNLHRLWLTLSEKTGAEQSYRNLPSKASSLWISGSGSPDPSHK